MDGLAGLSILIYAVILGIILFTALALYWLSGYLIVAFSLPHFLRWFMIPLGLLAGFYVAYFVVFDDLGRAHLAKTFPYYFEVEIPNNHKGQLWIFFDPSKPDLIFDKSRILKLTLPPNGEMMVGLFPDINEKLAYAEFNLFYPDGTKAPLATLPSRTGSIGSSHYMTFYIGEQNELDHLLDESLKSGKDFLGNEQEVLDRLRRAS